MKILLINQPWRRFFKSSSVLPPMGLSHIGAYLKSQRPDLDIKLYDADLAPVSKRFYYPKYFSERHLNYVARVTDLNDPVWLEVRQFLEKFSPDVIGISVMTASYTSGLVLAKLAKSILPQCKIILGGKHVTALPELALENESVDYIVIGEGEETLTELVANLETPSKVLGIYFKNENGEIVFTGNRPLIKDLNKLPLPIFLAENDEYDFQFPDKAGDWVWELIGARGCPFKCSFCATDHKVRVRSPEHILDEIEYIYQHFGVNQFRFQDDSFSFSEKRAVEICNALKETGFSWECSTRVDLLNDDIVKLMKTSNCRKVSIGIESVSETTLERIHKKITPDAVRKAVALLKKYGIKVNGFFMIGFPWEKYHDMKATVDFCKELKLDSYDINFFVPLPGTELFNDLVAAGKINIESLDWTKFQQLSYYMNYSDYSDTEWIAMLKSFQKKRNWDEKFRHFIYRLKYLKEPGLILKKIFSRFKNICRHRTQ